MRRLTATGDIDSAIERLDAALQEAGFGRLAPPEDCAALDEVEVAVAPYALPIELRRFWERIDTSSLGISLFPPLHPPGLALELQQVDLEFEVPSRPPPNFLVIGYESHVHRSIELASEWSDGGAILRWEWTVDGFAIAYRRLADLVDIAAEIVSEGDFERVGDLVYVREETERRKQLARLETAGAHPLYGDATEISGDLRSWPAHWLCASGIDLRDREPLGATHTIAELVHAAERGPVRGRVAGRVTRLAGSSAGSIALVDDGTRELDVWCPEGTSPWGPVMGERFEFEVVIEGPVGAALDFDTGHAEVQRHALAGRVEQAQEAADAFLGRIAEHRAPAVATDVRPLD